MPGTFIRLQPESSSPGLKKSRERASGVSYHRNFQMPSIESRGLSLARVVVIGTRLRWFTDGSCQSSRAKAPGARAARANRERRIRFIDYRFSL